MNKIFVFVMSAILFLTACSKNDDNSSQVEMTTETKMPSDIIGSWVLESSWKNFGPQGGPNCGDLTIEEKNIIDGGGQQVCNIKQVDKVDKWHKLSVSCDFCDEGECQNSEYNRYFSYDNDKKVLIEKFYADGGENVSLSSGNDENKFTRCLPNQPTEKVKSVNNSSQKEIDCESSLEAYQSCLSEMRGVVQMSFKKSGLPKEFQGTWVVSKEQCGNEASMYSSTEISARSYNEIDNPCDINEVFMINSPQFLKLNLKCINDYTDENSGYYNRSVFLALDNNKLEISSDSIDQAAKPYKLVRCP